MARLTIADLEIERPDEGFEIEIAEGVVFVFQDPKALSVEAVMELENLSPRDQAKALIADGKWDEFVSRPEVDVYLFEAVMKRYAEHFGLGSLGEGIASLRSVSGTARPSKRTSPKRVSR